MPEGPEVKRIARDLAEYASNKFLTDVCVLSGRYLKSPITGFDILRESLPARVVGAGSHGKFLYVLMSNGVNIWSTLGMTGRWARNRSKHARVQFTFKCNSKIYFDDIRNFGTVKFVYGPNILKARLMKLGPDMLSEDVTPDLFIHHFRKKDKWNITKAMMDQTVVAGIGNYVKAESLWLAGISPNRLVSDLTDGELMLLNEAVKDVMRSSYESGGATFSTHKNFSDEMGDYSSRFLCYNRKQDAEGNKVIKTKTADGRITHWAPDRQK